MSDTETPIKHRGELSLTLGETKFVLEPSFARIDKLESELGKPLIQLAAEMAMFQRLSFRDVASIIHIMAKGSKLSRNEVGDLLVRHSLQAALPGLKSFFAQVLGGDGDSGKNEAGESA